MKVLSTRTIEADDQFYLKCFVSVLYYTPKKGHSNNVAARGLGGRGQFHMRIES